MQIMSWSLARLGSRFGFLFEPYRQRVMHSALGRFLDQPMDLMVGLIDPDGTQRVLPLTSQGTPLANCEQFPRMNSITFRGYSEAYRLRFEFNVHSVFYPEDEKLCQLPAFYLEMRVNPVSNVRWFPPQGDAPTRVKLFLRLSRAETQITAAAPANGETARLDLAYRNTLEPRNEEYPHLDNGRPPQGRSVAVRERIVSLNPDAVADADGHGLTLELPVTEEGSGIKWRLVWGSYVGDPVVELAQGKQKLPGRLCYTKQYQNIDEVMQAAVTLRDNYLGHSRRFEKLFDQVALEANERHLINQTFQAYLANTYWCDLSDGREWFSVTEGSCFFHSTVDVEYNIAPLYLALWPRLLALELDQWPLVEKPHAESGGGILSHDLGLGTQLGQQAYQHDMPIEENANYLLLLQAYTYHSADLAVLRKHAGFVERLAKYLLWTDRDGSGFPSEGTANTIDDAAPATQYARKQTYLAIKRMAALQAAGDLLERIGNKELARVCVKAVDAATPRIEQEAWLGDHFAVCVERSGLGVNDAWTGKPLSDDVLAGWDAYSIYTANGLVLPLLSGHNFALDLAKLQADLVNAARETLGRYGCGHTSNEIDNVWVSQNIWRDLAARYLNARVPNYADYYWDLQAMSNTHRQSLGFSDTYINNHLCFYPRGIACIGWFFARPRLIIDRLAPGGARISVEPDTHQPQRWPLLALADWKAGKIPVCVVDVRGKVSIEGEIDPVIIRSGPAGKVKAIG